MRRWLWLLLIPIVLGLGLFAADFPRTASDDMAPTLRKGDLLLACRLCGAPDRGDVVVFSNPDQHGELSIRRVVGAPGDKVEVRKGEVLVNGIPLVDTDDGIEQIEGVDSGLANRGFNARQEIVGAHHFRVIQDLDVRSTVTRPPQMLEDEYFLLSDRRTLARDSRDYGPIKTRDVRSIVIRVLHAGDGDARRQTKVP